MLPNRFIPVLSHKTAYNVFSKYHFVNRKPACVSHCFVIEPDIACIVYAYPALSHRARRQATGNMFGHGSRSEIATRLNKNIRAIARIVVNPKYRKRRMASNLIEHTMPLVGVPFIECSTNLFGASQCFVNAGMARFMPTVPDIWFEVKAMYKQLGFENVKHLNFRHQRIFFDHLTGNQLVIFLNVAKKYLGNVHVYKENEHIFTTHLRLINRFDQVPVYFHWRNPDIALID